MANIKSDDLACRKSVEIYDWYHPDWFWQDDTGNLYFIPPAFGFLNGFLHGINGRHRAVLLFKHMEVIPMLLVLPNEWPRAKLAEIVLKKIFKNEIVELPNLPINTAIKKQHI